MQFSIIVPTFDRPRRLQRLLGSLRGLDYPRDAFEVIVVDDGGSRPLGERVDPLRAELDVTLVRQPHGGAAGARNRGAERARGQFLAFTDDDCTPEPDWLRRLEAAFEAHPGALVGGGTVCARPEDVCSLTSQLVLDLSFAYYNRDPGEARMLASSNLAAPADRFREIGGFRSDFRVASEDRELCDRWRHTGWPAVFVADVRVVHDQELDLPGFLRQYVRYGAGARQYHRLRRLRRSGRLSRDARMYLELPALLRRCLPRTGPGGTLGIASLLACWQAANLVGFLAGSRITGASDPGLAAAPLRDLGDADAAEPGEAS